MEVREFIEGWDITQLLGEGTFAEVKLLVNRETGEACAMKQINLTSQAAKENADGIRKEICVHKLLNHTNIVRCYGSRTEIDNQFIFLEYCSGGELFDRIEPEVGMPEHEAHKFFKMLLSAVSYLHERGIAHRDIKPENILLSDTDVLKLSDFGMATVFRHKGRERLMERSCGTMPYIAPEVLTKNAFSAGPADIWSCGIVLVAMLSGELPWDCPTPDHAAFEAWRGAKYERAPWSRIESLSLSLVRKILTVAPSKRYTLEQIGNHLWMKKKFKEQAGNLPLSAPSPKYPFITEGEYHCGSQPASKVLKSAVDAPADSSCSGDKASYVFPGFSQPARLSNIYTGSQHSQASQSQSQKSQSSRFHLLVKRMTRFWVDLSLDKTEAYLRTVLTRMGYGVTAKTKGIYNVETTDRRGAILVFKITFIVVEGRVLVDFRLSRGSGLEFKRHFAGIKTNCQDIVNKAPILWTNYLPVETMPGVIKNTPKKNPNADEAKKPSEESKTP